jgi:TonB family protein
VKIERFLRAGPLKLPCPLGAVVVLLTFLIPQGSSAAQSPEALAKALAKGEALMAQGKHRAAIRALRKAERLSTEPAGQVLLNLAVCFNLVGEFDKSGEYARATLEVAEDAGQKAGAFFMLGLSLPDVAAEEAEAAFRKVLEITGGQANIARYRLGEVLKRQGRHQDAWAAFSEYVERQPDGEHSAAARSAMDSLACWLEQSDPVWNVSDNPDIVPPARLFTPSPQYPPAAHEARIEGVVSLEAIIDKNGAVRCTNILRGMPMGLSQSAVDTVRTWKFEPATLHGEPVAVLYSLSVHFRPFRGGQ